MKRIMGFSLAGSIVVCLAVCLSCQPKQEVPTPQNIEAAIASGNFETATQSIKDYVAVSTLSPQELMDWNWKQDWMSRVALDFTLTREDVVDYIRTYYPDVTDEQITAWETSKALECMVLNGEKRYFNRSRRNLFRIDSACRTVYEAKEGVRLDEEHSTLHRHLPQVIAAARQHGRNLVAPHTYNITYTLTVPANTVPAGEVLRVWMPLPRTDVARQTDFRLLSTSQPNYIISPDAFAHKSLYMEAPAVADSDAVFQYTFTYTAWAEYHCFDPQQDVKPYDTTSELFRTYTAERLPHVPLDARIRDLAKEVVGSETNPYEQLKKIYTYIDTTFPWAGAREYSTLDCIPHYVLDNRHGDCGQVSLLFISLCRATGIPARWQSGWMLHPGAVNLHDWAEAYLEGIGWVPVDQSFGIQKGPETAPWDEPLRYFFTHGMDAYRLVANADYSAAFFPAKIYPRSETVDFQRGEVEWRGGNLYFNTWDYDLTVNSVE